MAERLKSRKQIDFLFRSAKSFSVFPLRVFYRWEGSAAARVGVGAPKRHFKRAVDRNRIKRLLREGYRLQKEALPGLHAFIIYTGKELPTQAEIMDKIGVILKKLRDLQP
ncbi:ribonuclease P protein component [Dinghuibacter silviterrae]|nr:ribonuclease P protein component [Dinghuibacter silviterrae]